MEDLKIVNADNLLYTSLDEAEFIIEDILPIELHIFCGAPKVGKSCLKNNGLYVGTDIYYISSSDETRKEANDMLEEIMKSDVINDIMNYWIKKRFVINDCNILIPLL